MSEPLTEIVLSTLQVNDRIEVATDGGTYYLTVLHPVQGRINIQGRPIYSRPQVRYVLDPEQRPVVRTDQPLRVYPNYGLTSPVEVGQVQEIKVITNPFKIHR